jgi:pantoate--beta-alanine ligase
LKVYERICDLPHPDGTVGFVPTMGALHAGHTELLRRSVAENCTAVLSIFVNPTQFGPNEDFARYPRTLEADLEIAKQAGVDYVFVPSVDEMYPNRSVSVQVHGVSTRWEGKHRPGHFDGVATIVAKLFGAVQPDVAYFGQKDLQQYQVIKLMTDGLNLPVTLKICDTVREDDGLAMSSRNRYLTDSERQKAPKLYASLRSIAEGIRIGNAPSRLIEAEATHLSKHGFELDYLAYVSLPDMVEIDEYKESSALIVAAKLGNTRLIDNLVFF